LRYRVSMINIFSTLALFSISIEFIYCLCSIDNSCYDYLDQKCKQIDGIKFIGREKNHGFCVIESEIYNEIDYCYSVDNYICITKNRKSCFNILNNSYYVAIQDKTHICLGLNDYVSNMKDQNQSLAFIKKGFCISNDGRIIQGDPLNTDGFTFQCSQYILSRIQLEYQCLDNQCLDESKYTCADMSQVPGITENGICVFENIFYKGKISCNQQYCNYINKLNMSTCLLYSSKLVIGISQKGDCIFDLEETRNLYILSSNSYQCSSDQCYDGKQCIRVGPNDDYIAKLEDESCGTEKQSKAIKCFHKKEDVCLLNDKCYFVNNNNKISGFSLNGDCVEAETYISNLEKCKDDYCIKNKYNMKGCFLIDGSSGQFGVDNEGNCLDINEANAVKCTSGNNEICLDKENKKCVKKVSYCNNNTCCIFNSTCYQLSLQGYLGRTNDLQCLEDNTSYPYKYVDICLDDNSNVCQSKDKKKCVNYKKSINYLGYIKDTGKCAELDQEIKQYVLNLNDNYCKIDNKIKKLQDPYVGRDKDNQTCLKESQQSESIEFCIKGYCVADKSCRQIGFDEKQIAKLEDQKCSEVNKEKSIECAFKKYDFCLYDQQCYQLQQNKINIAGIDVEGKCFLRDYPILESNIQRCADFHCIAQNNTKTYAQCSLIDGISYAGIDDKGHCLNLKQAIATKCPTLNKEICFDQDNKYCTNTKIFGALQGCSLNGICFALSNSEYVGRDLNQNCLTNLQKAIYDVDQCVDDQDQVCFDQNKQLCAIYPISLYYLGYVIDNKQCAVQDQPTNQFKRISNLKNLKKNYCQDSKGYIRQLDYKHNVGVDQNNFICLTPNTPASWSVIQCYDGFCVNNNSCVKYDKILIGRDSSYKCLKQSEKISVQCHFEINACLDIDQQACFIINDIDSSHSGLQQNGQCAKRGQFYSNIKKCSYNHCRIKQIPDDPNSQEGCFAFDASQRRVGIDSNDYCVNQDEQNSVRCMEGQFCLNNQLSNTCQSLEFSYKKNNFARQAKTDFCLPYLDKNSDGDNIETCVKGSCLYIAIAISTTQRKSYCFTEGTIFEGYLILGTDIKGICVLENQLSTTQIETCLGNNYCILQIEPNKYKCQELKEPDKSYPPNLVYRAKNVNQTCQDINDGKYQSSFNKNNFYLLQGNSIGCLSGRYCLDQSLKQCVKLNPEDSRYIGRSELNQECLEENMSNAIKCAQGYCIQYGACVPLSDQTPGKELETDYCLKEKFESKKGIESCYKQGNALNVKKGIYYLKMVKQFIRCSECYILNYNSTSTQLLYNDVSQNSALIAISSRYNIGQIAYGIYLKAPILTVNVLNSNFTNMQQDSQFNWIQAFQLNKASMYGGVIFLENTQENILFNTLKIFNCTFGYNEAIMGGSIGSTTYQGIDYFSHNQFFQNKALKYGQNIQASPVRLVAYVNGIKQQGSIELIVKNHKGGYLQDSIEFRLVNDQSEELLDLNLNATLNLKIKSGIGFISVNQLQHNNGKFSLTEQLQVYGKKGQQILLKISSNLIQVPQFDKEEQIISYDKTYQFIVNIQFAYNCPPGQVIKLIYNKYDFCSDCKELTYSLNISDNCFKCPHTSVFCKGNQILLPSNFWRVNQNSDVLYQCKNCVGDLDNTQGTSSKKVIFEKNRTDLDYYCKEGHIGALCEDCDRTGQYWNECSGVQTKDIIYVLIFIVFPIIITAQLSISYLSQIHIKYKEKVVTILLNKFIDKFDLSNIRKIKFCLFQSYIIGIIFTFDSNIPNIIQQIFLDIGNLFNSQLRIAECFIDITLSSNQIILMTIIFKIILHIGMIVLFIIIILYKYHKYFAQLTILGILIFIYYTQTAILSNLFKSITCQPFGGVKFVTEFLSIQCDEFQQSRPFINIYLNKVEFQIQNLACICYSLNIVKFKINQETLQLIVTSLIILTVSIMLYQIFFSICYSRRSLYLRILYYLLLIPFINCYCKEQKECYDTFDKKCKQIDGINFIGKDKTHGLCVIESVIYDQIDFCFSLSYPVCLTQNMQSCVNVFKSSYYVAIQQQTQLCLALYDYAQQTKGQIKSLTFIKEGYCLDNENKIIEGQVLNKQNQCLDKRNYSQATCVDLLQANGITEDGICVFESVFYASRIRCNTSYCIYTNYLNYSTCLQYTAHQVVGKTLNNNKCIRRGEKLGINIKSICKRSFCRLINQLTITCVEIKNSFNLSIIGVSEDGDCIQDSKKIENHYRLAQVANCAQNECFDGTSCILLGSDQNQLTIGQTLEGLCVYINQSYNDILFCSSQYCISNQLNSTYSCVPFNGSPQAIGIDSQGNCLNSTQQAQICFHSYNICQDPITKYCIDISLSDSLCAINGICYQMSMNQTPLYIGRDNKYNCLLNSQTSPQNLPINKCLNIPNQICQKSDLTQCIIYTNSTTYLGYISSSGICAQLGQNTSLQSYQNILNLSQDYCQDKNFVIQQINPQFQGRYTQYQMCLQTSQPQINLTVEFCISGYCTQGLNSCQKIGFDGVFIAKLLNGTCGIAQQTTAIQCACFNCDVCLYNSQSCYLLQNQNITSGIDTNGNCLSAGTYISNLLKCQQNYCILKNQSGQSACVLIDGSPGQFGVDINGNCLDANTPGAINGQSACVLIDGSPGQFGVDINGNCLDANTPGAIKCTDKPNVVCYDQLNQMCIKITDFVQNQNGCILNSTCQQFSLEQFIGRDKNFKCLLDQQNIDGTSIDTCLNNIDQVCKSYDQMKCILYRNSNVYLGYIKETGICAQLNKNTSTTAYSTISKCSFNHCRIKQNPSDPNSPEGCFPFDESLQRIGIDQNGYCVQQDVQNAVSMGSYKCQKLSDPLSNYPNLVFRAKNANQTCQDINTGKKKNSFKIQILFILIVVNSIGCLDGWYCLDSISAKCVELNPNDPLKIGRDKYSQQCISQGTGFASKCALGYCIYQWVCIPLSKQKPGKELNTDLCLIEKAQGQYGASSCYNQGQINQFHNQKQKKQFIYKSYCFMKNSITGLLSCYKLDFNNPNAIGIEKDTQNCISYNQSIAVVCAIQRYCLDPQTSQCKYIDSNQNLCVDQYGKCTTNGQCFSCNIDQCLDTSKTCQNLVSNSHGNCFICPDQFCQINNYCLNSYQLLNQLKLNECFYINQYKQCLLKNINQPDSNGDNYCSNNKGICQNLSQSSDQCLQCPNYYTNPGNQHCFSIDQKYALYSNQQTVYFQMKLTYVKQDCYDQDFCKSNNMLKCQTGQFLLKKEDDLIQTFLYFIQLLFLHIKKFLYLMLRRIFFILRIYNKINMYLMPRFIIFRLRSLNLLFKDSYLQMFRLFIRIWILVNIILLLKTIIKIIFQGIILNRFLELVQTIQSNQIILYKLLIIIFKLLIFMLISQMGNLCQALSTKPHVLFFFKLIYIYLFKGQQDCYSCMQITSSIATCLQCKLGFTLQNGVCISCPKNCVNCQYASLVSGQIILLAQQNLDQSQIINGNYILVCLQCQVSFMVAYNLQSCIDCGIQCNYCQYGEDCIQNIQFCDKNTVNINIGSNTVDLSSQIWSFISRTSTFTYNYQCKKCKQNYSLTDQGQCVSQGCQAIGQCYSCQFIEGKDNCLFCMGGNVLSNLQSPSKCQNDICQKNIYMCSECYLYSDSLQAIQFYQCTRCTDQNSIPSYNGCIKCPNGCSSCYEGTRDFNLTNQIIYDRGYLTLKQRLEYNQDNKYSLYCTNCLDSYYLDQQTKQCLQIQCGQNCLLCKLINNKPQCMQCNYNKLYSQISQLSFFIAKFYFNQNNIPNFNQMVSITASGNDCQVCPMMCETCINNSNLITNPLQLYDSQCLSCKKPFSSNSDLQNYKIIFDKIRRKCYFCNNQEQGCYYKKQRVIYTQCLDAGSSLGVGTLQNPINYNKLNQINIDQLILDEIDFDQAIVYYNELQVKQLEVQLIFIGELCVEQKPQVFITTLKDQVRSLETAVLNITTLNSNQNKSMTFQQLDAFRIQGFDQISIDGILFKQNQDFQNFGIIANDKNLTNFNLLNCSFFQLYQKNQVKQYLMMSLSTLQQAKLIQINNTLTNSSIYIEFNQVLFNQVIFSNSNLVHLSFQNVTLQILNSIFNKTAIQNQALLLDIQQSLFDQQIRIKFDNLTYYQCQIANNSQILNSNFLNQLDINNMAFIQSQFSQGLSNANPLIASNQFTIKGFKLLSSQIINFSFLQQYDNDSSLKIQMEYSYFENFLIQNNKFYQNNNLLLKFQSKAQNNITINGMLVQENQFQESVRPIIIQLSNLNSIQINNIITIDNTYFTFLKADYSKYVFVSNIFQKQTNYQLLSPQLFQLNQIKKEINFLNITQQSIVISSNIIQIDNSFNKFYDGLLQISILNYQSTQTKLQYYNVTQNCALIAITSMQNSYLKIDQLNLTDFQTVSLIKNNQIGQIAYGIHITAPTLIVDVLNSNFTNLQLNSQFNWIEGSLKQINFDNCYFSNNNRIFNFISQINGGFFKIISEQLITKNSFFINGNAFNGGAFYWVSQNRGHLSLINTVFFNNTASNVNYFESQGGAVYIDGLSSFSYDIQIQQCIFQNNFALLSGGAIQIKTTISPRSAIVIEYSYFYDNLSNKGSNINIDSSKSAQTRIIFQNIACINNIKNIINLAQQVSSLIVKQIQQGAQNYASLIAIKDANQVQIIQSHFKIIPNNFQPNTSPLTVNLILQKILLIISVQYFDDVSNVYEDSIFLGNLITVTKVYKIQIINTSITNNNGMLSNFPITEQSQNIVSYSSEVCIIKLLKANQNTCQNCSLGVINIQASYLIIQNSTFENNIAINGSSLFIQQTESKMVNYIPITLQNVYNLQIIDSQFKNNTALKRGGAIYIKGSSVQINNTLFYKNEANLHGGAIYLENTDQNILKNTLQLFNCTFDQNYATMGGSIGSSTYQAINRFSQNQFILNKAFKYGQNIQISPSRLVIYINGVKQSDIKQLVIVNHQGGYLKDSIVFRLSNDQNEELLELNKDETLQIKIENGFGFISINELKQISGEFNLTQQIQIYGKNGQQLQLKISSNLIKVPQYNQQEQIISYDKSYTFKFVIQFIQHCPIGKVVQHIYNKYDFCSECYESTYSLQVSDSCNVCPSKDVYCKGNQILIPSNLWRVNQNSSKLFYCKNCIGDLDIVSKNSLNQALFQVKRTDLNYYCKEGYLGALCEDCDRGGQFWGQKYFMGLNQKCLKCSEFSVKETIYILIFVIVPILIVIWLACSFQNQIQLKLKNKVIALLLNKQIDNFDLNQIRRIKFFLFQSFLIGMIFSFDSNIPNILQIIFIDVGNLFSSQLRIAECFLESLWNNNYIILKAVFFQILLQISILALLIVTIVCLCKKQISQLIILGTYIFTFYSQTAIISKLYKSMICQSFDNIMFVTEFLSVYCNESQQKTSYGIIMPLIFLIFMLPHAILLKNMYQNRYILLRYGNQITYGFFTCDYKPYYYFWDLVKLTYKNIMCLLLYFSYQTTVFPMILALLVSMIYSILVFLCKPFESSKLNKIEFHIQNIVCICISLNAIQLNISENILSITVTCLIVLLVIIMIYLIFSQISKKQNSIYLTIIEYLQNNSYTCALIINRFYLNKQLLISKNAKQNWQKLRYFFILKKLNNNRKLNIEQQNLKFIEKFFAQEINAKSKKSNISKQFYEVVCRQSRTQQKTNQS
ncbi:hypothetical protein ABPG73_004611, partial [Tetrahymena malaccensis]